jgi:hypothetical protein
MEGEECGVRAKAAAAEHAVAARRQKRLQKAIAVKLQSLDAARCDHATCRIGRSSAVPRMLLCHYMETRRRRCLLYVRSCNRRAAAAEQPRVDELAASEASLAAQLQAMQQTLMGSGRDLSSVAALKVLAKRHV